MGSIALSPTSGNPGVTINVAGRGFGRNQSIRLRVDSPNGAVKTYKCNTKGNFNGTVVTGAASSLGIHTVDVTSATSLTILAHAIFTLVAPTHTSLATGIAAVKVKGVLPNAPTLLSAVAGNAVVSLTWGPPP